MYIDPSLPQNKSVKVYLRLFGTSNYHVYLFGHFAFAVLLLTLACPSAVFAAVVHDDDDNYNDDKDEITTTARPCPS